MGSLCDRKVETQRRDGAWAPDPHGPYSPPHPSPGCTPMEPELACRAAPGGHGIPYCALRIFLQLPTSALMAFCTPPLWPPPASILHPLIPSYCPAFTHTGSLAPCSLLGPPFSCLAPHQSRLDHWFSCTEAVPWSRCHPSWLGSSVRPSLAFSFPWASQLSGLGCAQCLSMISASLLSSPDLGPYTPGHAGTS